jgi:hypothetical protein
MTNSENERNANYSTLEVKNTHAYYVKNILKMIKELDDEIFIDENIFLIFETIPPEKASKKFFTIEQFYIKLASILLTKTTFLYALEKPEILKQIKSKNIALLDELIKTNEELKSTLFIKENYIDSEVKESEKEEIIKAINVFINRINAINNDTLIYIWNEILMKNKIYKTYIASIYFKSSLLNLYANRHLNVKERNELYSNILEKTITLLRNEKIFIDEFTNLLTYIAIKTNILKSIVKDINESFFEELEENTIFVIEKLEMKIAKVIKISDIEYMINTLLKTNLSLNTRMLMRTFCIAIIEKLKTYQFSNDIFEDVNKDIEKVNEFEEDYKEFKNNIAINKIIERIKK